MIWTERLPPRLIQEVMKVLLWEICRIRPFPLRIPMISALVHRLCLETRTFPLPCGELGITLVDLTTMGVSNDEDPLLCDPPSVGESI
ncbi:hypothetical protein AMTR_s00096p00118660 [Amborella trichopoda]|uniref:Aminotransferase-like plant mobile domain-containing protein n=1 Tax=Amborella trichopoda TaxID=13333 RepID=W1P3B9_AMBTC|nr:hypothetical protein AMTR_s00096p00118660 [Amborella trichopoda]